MPTGNRGQALVETSLVIVLVLGIFFALTQLFFLITSRLTAFDAVQSMARAAAVRKNHISAAAYVLSSQKIGSQFFPVEVKVTRSNSSDKILIARITYLQKTIFPGFFSSITSLLPGDAACRMTESPEPGYLDKAYPGARRE